MQFVDMYFFLVSGKEEEERLLLASHTVNTLFACKIVNSFYSNLKISSWKIIQPAVSLPKSAKNVLHL